MTTTVTRERLTLGQLGHDPHRERPNHLAREFDYSGRTLCGQRVAPPWRSRADREKYGLCVVCAEIAEREGLTS